MTDDEVALLTEAYEADPTWNSKGAARFIRPASIRAGRLVIELNEDAAPKAVANFRCLCTGEKGVGKGSGKPLHYKGSTFHRIVRLAFFVCSTRAASSPFPCYNSGFVAQGGDFVRGDGSGGDSIYGGKFNDDKAALKLKHDAAGIVAMANSGKNTNSCQFYITLAPAPACDGKHVVFGRVVEGMDVVTRIGTVVRYRRYACKWVNTR